MTADRVEILSAVPFRLRRRVTWGECDPAGVVYTPRFGDYVVEAFLEFGAQLFGRPLHDRLHALDLDLPAKAMTLEFQRSLTPDQCFDVSVLVAELRTRTFDLAMRATTPEGSPLFVAKFTLICVQPHTRASCAIPPLLRQKLESYRAATS